jgi:hypothetical protein
MPDAAGDMPEVKNELPKEKMSIFNNFSQVEFNLIF